MLHRSVDGEAGFETKTNRSVQPGFLIWDFLLSYSVDSFRFKTEHNRAIPLHSALDYLAVKLRNGACITTVDLYSILKKKLFWNWGVLGGFRDPLYPV